MDTSMAESSFAAVACLSRWSPIVIRIQDDNTVFERFPGSQLGIYDTR